MSCVRVHVSSVGVHVSCVRVHVSSVWVHVRCKVGLRGHFMTSFM